MFLLHSWEVLSGWVGSAELNAKRGTGTKKFFVIRAHSNKQFKHKGELVLAEGKRPRSRAKPTNSFKTCIHVELSSLGR